jgi:hypothetical protein
MTRLGMTGPAWSTRAREDGVDSSGSRPGSDQVTTWAADPAELARLLSRWREAEGRLYRLVLTAPELYELSLGLVRAVADELGVAATEAALVAAYASGPELVHRVAERDGVDLGLIDADAVVAAGFSLRHGELVAAHAREAALHRVQQARAAGRSWVTLHESGTIPRPGGQLGAGYHLVEGSLLVPWGVHASVTFDLDTSSMVYLVEPVAVDIAEASWWIPDEQPVPNRTCPDVDTWQAALADLRRALAATSQPA